MLTKELTEQINAVLSDDMQAAEQIMELSAEEAAAALCEKGLVVTADDVTAYIQAAQTAVSGGELDEQALENVAGGSVWSAIYNFLRGGGTSHTSSGGYSHGGGGGHF